jgi:hypothetical protein
MTTDRNLWLLTAFSALLVATPNCVGAQNPTKQASPLISGVAATLRIKGIPPFDMKPTVALPEKTKYEQDLENAEAARRDAAGWRDSAKADNNGSVAEAKRLAAQHADAAARDWDAAAEARKHGEDKKAAAYEEAAKFREEAAKAFGSDRNPGRGAAAARDAKAKEDKAKRGG